VWAAEKLVEFLYTSGDETVWARNSPHVSEETAMQEVLNATQEAEAQLLAQRIAQAAETELLQIGPGSIPGLFG
jgi:hypothetical protein